MYCKPLRRVKTPIRHENSLPEGCARHRAIRTLRLMVPDLSLQTTVFDATAFHSPSGPTVRGFQAHPQ